MPFTSVIKQQVMMASARHCCVCHRYKGINIEAHHIVPEADGGFNSFENAIALCFDCHSAAGHYNVNHPRGTRFSPQELYRSRDLWYTTVKEGTIPQKIEISDKVQVSYYVVRDFDILKSLMKGDFSSLNNHRNQIYLAKNHVSDEWYQILKSHKKDFEFLIEQSLAFELRQFESIDDFLDTYPNATIVDRASDDYPYYSAKRPVTWQELVNKVSPNNFVKQISHSGVNVDDFCVSVLQENQTGCGDDVFDFKFTEYVLIKPISFVFLGISNVNRAPIKLNNLIDSSNSETINLPNFNLRANEMVMLPVATVINLDENFDDSLVLSEIHGARGQTLERVLRNTNNGDKSPTFFNGRIVPKSIVFNDNNGEYQVDIHEFDPDNIYAINGFWNCGSCPHLFTVKDNGKQEYVRELLVNSSNKKGMDIYTVPSGVQQIIIRELEDEITYIDEITINEHVLSRKMELRKGDSIILETKVGDIVRFRGHYEPFFDSEPSLNDLWYRNSLIWQSNFNYNK